MALERRKESMKLLQFASSYRIQLLIVTTTLLHFIMASSLLLHPDEAYYWDWSRHLDYGYYDHPPMVAWAIWLFSFLPLSELTVRLPAILSAVIVALSTYSTIKQLGADKKLAWYGFLIVTISPWLTITAIINTPDVYALLFYTLTVQFGVRFAILQQKRWLYLVGLLVTLSTLSKLTNLFLLPVFLLWMLVDSRQRKWLSTIHPWLSALIGSLGIVVLSVWNYNNNNAMVYRLSELESGSVVSLSQGINESLGFILTNLFMLSPMIVLIIIIAIPSFRIIFSKLNSGWSLVLFAAIIPWIYAIPASVFAKFQGNWLVFCAVPLTILGVGIVHYKQTYNEQTTSYKWLKYSVYWFLLVFVLLNLAPVSGFARSRMRELNGWHELGSIIDKQIDQNSKESQLVVYAQRYQTAALIGFYSKYHPNVNTCSIGVRKSMYDLWTDHSKNAGKDVVFVLISRWKKPIPNEFVSAFDSFTQLENMPIIQHEKKVHELNLYYGTNFNPEVLPKSRF